MNKNKFFSLVFILLAGLVSGSAIAADWSASFNGKSGGSYNVEASTVDSSGNIYLAGDSTTNIGFGSTEVARIGIQDAFVVKLNAAGTVVWFKTFGGSGATTFGNSIAVDSAGNVYLGGSFSDANLTVSNNNTITTLLAKIGDVDAFAIKLDSSGTTTWAKNFGGSSASTRGRSIAVDGPGGNVYLGGNFSGADLINLDTTLLLAKIGNEDAFAIKLNSSGGTAWAKNFGGNDNGNLAQAYGRSIAVDGPDGNVYLGGSFQDARLTVSINNINTTLLAKIGDEDAFAIKLNSSGITTWAKNFGGSSAAAIGRSIAVDGPGGNVYLGGNFSGADLTVSINNTITTLEIKGDEDAFAIKLDSSGTTTWAKNFGGSSAEAYGLSIAVDGPEGNVYLGGYFSQESLSIPQLTKIGGRDAFAIKLNSSGTTTWAKNFGGAGGSSVNPQSIAVDGAGNVYLGGYFSDASLTNPYLTKVGELDAFAIKLNSTTGAATLALNPSRTVALGSVRVASSAVDSAGNVYIAGNIESDTNTFTLGSTTLTRIGEQDAFAAKLDSGGTVLWAKNFGGNDNGNLANTNGTSIAVDSAGNVYLGGFFNGADLTVSINNTITTLAKIGNEDAFAIKLDPDGIALWAKNFGGNGGAYAYGQSIAVGGPDGNVYLGGYFRGANLTKPDTTTLLAKIGDIDAFAIMLAPSSGTPIWWKNFGGNDNNVNLASTYGNSIAVDSTGNVYLGGYFSGAALTIPTQPTLGLIGYQDAFAIKLDSTTGAPTWAKNFGGSGGAYAYGQSIAVDGSGNVYLGGYFSGAALPIPTQPTTTLGLIGNQDAFAIKLDSTTGAPTWAKNFGGSAGAYTYGNGIAVDSTGNVYLGGFFESGDLTTPGLTTIGGADAYAIKLDSTTGAPTWSANYGGIGANAEGKSIAVDGAGNVYLGGDFRRASLTTPPLTLAATRHIFVLKRATVATVPTVNGACGTSANVATAFLPTANLCSTGTASNVTPGTSSWLWSCTGTGPSATNATCSAPYPVVSGGGGTVGAIQTQSTNGWQIDQAASGFVALPAPAPAGVTFPGGATKVVLNTGAQGTSATVILRFSSIPAGAQLYKYGKENGIGDSNTWFAYPANIDFGAGTVTYTLTDGQRGDNDWTANSVIDDPVALGVNSVVASIPTLSEWGLIILSTLMALFGLVWMRRRQGFTA